MMCKIIRYIPITTQDTNDIPLFGGYKNEHIIYLDKEKPETPYVKIKITELESERRYGFIKHDSIKVDIGDLDKYGDADRFELLEDQEDKQDKVIEGSRTQVIIGHTLSYRCKARGHGIAVFIPIAEYNAMKKTKKKEE